MSRTRKTTTVMRLGLELQGIGSEELAVLRRYCDAKDGYSREILAPAEMTLHSLHYAIMRLFGWINGHLHRFTLPPKTMDSLTKGRLGEYLKLAGLYFRSPADIDRQDIFWDDDYHGEASFRTWLRRKYTAPYHFLGRAEQFMAARKATIDFLRKNRALQPIPGLGDRERETDGGRFPMKPLAEVTLEEAGRIPDLAIGELSERLTLEEILGKTPATPEQVRRLCHETTVLYERNTKSLEELRRTSGLSHAATRQVLDMAMLTMNPKALPLCDKLFYEFDFGDGWEIAISLRGTYGIKSLDALDGDLTTQVRQVAKAGRPLCIAMDGRLPLVQDVGGTRGYCDFLATINGTDARRDLLEWAKGLGWTGRRSTPEKLL